MAGSPQECIEQLAMYEREYDVDYVVMRFRLPGGPERERVLDCIKLVWRRSVTEVSPIALGVGRAVPAKALIYLSREINVAFDACFIRLI